MLRYSGRDVIHANRRLGYSPSPTPTARPPRAAPPRCGSGPRCGPRPTAARAGRRPQARHPRRPRQAAPVRRRRATRPRPGRSPLRRPAVRGATWPRSGTSAGGRPSGSSARPGPSSRPKSQVKTVCPCPMTAMSARRGGFDLHRPFSMSRKRSALGRGSWPADRPGMVFARFSGPAWCVRLPKAAREPCLLGRAWVQVTEKSCLSCGRRLCQGARVACFFGDKGRFAAEVGDWAGPALRGVDLWADWPVADL